MKLRHVNLLLVLLLVALLRFMATYQPTATPPPAAAQEQTCVSGQVIDTDQRDDDVSLTAVDCGNGVYLIEGKRHGDAQVRATSLDQPVTIFGREEIVHFCRGATRPTLGCG